MPSFLAVVYSPTVFILAASARRRLVHSGGSGDFPAIHAGNDGAAVGGMPRLAGVIDIGASNYREG